MVSEEAIHCPARALALAEFRGNAVTVALIRRLHGAQHLSPALLFDGPQGCGKRTLALAVAKMLLCHQPLADGDACGQCVACQEVESGIHPDCLVLPDDRELPLLPVETIRESLVNAASESALMGRGRVFIVPAVERLRHEAANALLKILEEPPPEVRIIMTSAMADGLMATIRSRAQRFRLQALSPADLAHILSDQGVQAEHIAWVIRQPGASLRSASNRHHAPPLDVLAALIADGYDAQAIAALSDQLAGDSDGFSGGTPLARQRNCLRWWLDMAIEDQRRRLGEVQDVEAALSRIEALLQARNDVAVNITPRLVLEALALGPA